MSKMKNECELTPVSKRVDDYNCQIENYKEYEDMLKVSENKK